MRFKRIRRAVRGIAQQKFSENEAPENTVGIYSFPKSGNTWMRAIVASMIGANVQQIPDLYQRKLSEAKTCNGFRFYKLHAGRNLKTWKGSRLNTTHVIHIRRNPLDVFISYLNNQSRNVSNQGIFAFDTVEDIVGTELFDLYFKSWITLGHIDPRIYEDTLDYFSHNANWLSEGAKGKTKVHCLKYEDLLEKPFETISFLQEWLGVSDQVVKASLARASSQTARNGKFFWKQKEKNYLDYLTDEQIALFLKYRGKDAERIGYDPHYLSAR